MANPEACRTWWRRIQQLASTRIDTEGSALCGATGDAYDVSHSRSSRQYIESDGRAS